MKNKAWMAGVSTTGRKIMPIGGRRAAAALVMVISLAAVLTGCTSSHKTASSFSEAGGAAGGANQSAAAVPAERSSDTASSTAQAGPADRSVVRTASVDVRTAAVDAAANKIIAMATPNGGRVDSDQRRNAGADRTAEIVLRVRPDRLDAVVGAVGALGQETARSIEGQDVTTTRADVTARVAALATSVKRLRQLLSRSGTVSDLVELERQLTTRESDLEAMRARQTALLDQIDLATLTVNLSVPPNVIAAAGPRGIHPTGFFAAVGSGFHAVVVGVRLVLAGVGYALPAMVPAGIVVLLVLQWRRRRHPSVRREEPAPAAS